MALWKSLAAKSSLGEDVRFFPPARFRKTKDVLRDERKKVLIFVLTQILNCSRVASIMSINIKVNFWKVDEASLWF